jgi:hypothetical protein
MPIFRAFSEKTGSSSIIFIIDSQYRYDLIKPVPTIEDYHYGCLQQKIRQFKDKFPGSKGIEMLADEQINMSIECYEEAKRDRLASIRFQLKKKSMEDLLNLLFEYLMTNWQSFAFLISLLIIIPVTLIINKDLKKLSIETNRPAIINNSFTHIYIGLLMQTFIEIFSFIS